MDLHCEAERGFGPADPLECLQSKKGLFLLSSIFTFLVALSSVLLWEGARRILCPAEEEEEEKGPGAAKTPPKSTPVTSDKNEEIEPAFSSKDWANKLISGQTFAGKIMVR